MDTHNKYNPEIHHRRSVRLRDYDYSQQGLYFITLCVKNRVCMFGNITEGEIRLTEIGEIVRREWLKTAELRPNVTLHNFVVMPNHFHGILEITEKCDVAKYENDVMHDVGALRATPLQTQPRATQPPPQPQQCRPYARTTDYEKNEYMSAISPKSDELGTIIRAFKSAATKSIHDAGYEFSWQRNLWEHVIRDAADYARINDYISNNPFRWNDDIFYNE